MDIQTNNETEVVVLPNGETVVFYPSSHSYFVRDKKVPSITELIQNVYGNSYANVNPELLQRSAEYGTKVHKQIQDLIDMRLMGLDISDLLTDKNQETRNYFTYIEPIYKVNPLFTEKIVVLYNDNDEPVAAGRFDLACEVGEDRQKAICDFKTTSAIHTKNVSAQLNLYKKAAEQSGYFTKGEITYLGAIHISGEQYKLKPIQIFGEGFFKKFIK